MNTAKCIKNNRETENKLGYGVELNNLLAIKINY